MSSLAQSKQSKQFFSLKHETDNHLGINQQQRNDSRKYIEDKLDKCQQDFIEILLKIIRQWKAQNLQKYTQIVSKVDESLRKSIGKVFLEQIDLQKQNISMVLNQFREKMKIVQKTDSIHDKIKGNSSDETVVMYKSQEKQHKSRSISNDIHPRRRLSKGSYFADAKKVTPAQTKIGFSHTVNTTLGFHNKFDNTESKVKKVKRKDETCFELVQKCNNSVSATNFMMNYANNRQILRNNDQNIIEKSVFFDHKGLKQSNAGVNEQNDGPAAAAQSKTFQRLMIDFEEKISRRLDDFVSKCTKVQHKQQNSREQSKQIYSPEPTILINNQSQPQKLPLKNSYKQLVEKEHIVSIAENIVTHKENDELVNLPEASIVSLKKISLNETLNQKTQFNGSNQSTKIKNVNDRQALKTKGIKSIDVSNKIIKSNKAKIIQNFQDSLEQISINPTKSFISQQVSSKVIQKTSKTIDLQEQKKRQLQLQRKQSLNRDKMFFQSQFSEFYLHNQRLVLPINKQLLFLLKQKYESFCKKNNLTLNKQLSSIQVKKIENVDQYLKVIEKMQKSVNLKNQNSKIQKLLEFVQNFVKVFYLYDQQANTIVKNDEKLSRQILKSKLKQIKAQTPKFQ